MRILVSCVLRRVVLLLFRAFAKYPVVMSYLHLTNVAIRDINDLEDIFFLDIKSAAISDSKEVEMRDSSDSLIISFGEVLHDLLNITIIDHVSFAFPLSHDQRSMPSLSSHPLL